MSQHDYVLENDTGQAFRADLNNALAAIVSNNSGATEPSTMYAHQLWADTTTGLLKLRNSANNAWVTLGTLASTNLGLLSLAGGTMTGALLAAVGSVSAPGISFSGDSNTGIYWISADKFAVVVNGAAVMTFDAATYTQHNTTSAVLMPIGTTAQRPTGTAGLLRYNSDTSKFEGYAGGVWKDVGSGGGGGGIKWVEISGTAPIPSEEYSESVYLFGSGLAQELYTTIKVPQSYSAGSQIFLYVSAYSPSSSNTILLQSQSTLITPGSTAFDSTTNQRTSTNAALTNTVAKMAREFVLDLTDSSGQINSVAVAAGDLIKVKLYRGSDSDTADLRMVPSGTDVKFN